MCMISFQSLMCLGRGSTLKTLCHGLHLEDPLSRVPTFPSTPANDLFCHHVVTLIHLITGNLLSTEKHLLQNFKIAGRRRGVLATEALLLEYWPESCKIKGLVKLYHQVSSEIAIQD